MCDVASSFSASTVRPANTHTSTAISTCRGFGVVSAGVTGQQVRCGGVGGWWGRCSEGVYLAQRTARAAVTHRAIATMHERQ